MFEALSTFHEGQGNFFNTIASISKVWTVASKELSIKKELIIARTRKSSFQRVALSFFASGSDFELSKEFSSQSFGLHSNFCGKNWTLKFSKWPSRLSWLAYPVDLPMHGKS